MKNSLLALAMGTALTASLPALTQAVISTAFFLRKNAWLGAVGLAACIAGLRWLATTGPGRRWRDQLVLRLETGAVVSANAR